MKTIFAAATFALVAAGASAAPSPNGPFAETPAARAATEQTIQEARVNFQWHQPKNGRAYVCVRQNGTSSCSVAR